MDDLPRLSDFHRGGFPGDSSTFAESLRMKDPGGIRPTGLAAQVQGVDAGALVSAVVGGGRSKAFGWRLPPTTVRFPSRSACRRGRVV